MAFFFFISLGRCERLNEDLIDQKQLLARRSFAWLLNRSVVTEF